MAVGGTVGAIRFLAKQLRILVRVGEQCGELMCVECVECTSKQIISLVTGGLCFLWVKQCLNLRHLDFGIKYKLK